MKSYRKRAVRVSGKIIQDSDSPISIPIPMMSLIMWHDNESRRKIQNTRAARHGNEIISINVPFFGGTNSAFRHCNIMLRLGEKLKNVEYLIMGWVFQLEAGKIV